MEGGEDMADEQAQSSSGNGARSSHETPGRWLLRQIEETVGQITDEEWERMDMPDDAGRQYKHYRYGMPKRAVPNFTERT